MIPPPASPSPDQLAPIEQILRDALSALPDEPRETAAGRGRPRILFFRPLLGTMLLVFLHGYRYYADVWRGLCLFALWDDTPIPVCDEAVYARVEALGTAPFEQLFVHLGAVLASRVRAVVDSSLAPFASEVFVLDQSVLDRVARVLPSLRKLAAGDPGLLAGLLVGLFDVRRQQWHRLLLQTDPTQSEQHTAYRMILDLPKGCLILADLGYFCFEWFDDLTTLGYFWISRMQSRVSSVRVHTFYDRNGVLDVLVYLGQHRFNKAGQLVRLVEFDYKGKRYRYLTNVLDPTVLPIAEIARLYARRWDIELALAVIKDHLVLQGFACAKAVLVQQQVWTVLLLAQILHVLQLEIAAAAGVDPFAVSLPLLVRYAPLFLQQPTGAVVALLVERGQHAGIIRPSTRVEITVPSVDLAVYVPAPPELLRPRKARYARIRGPGYHTTKLKLLAELQAPEPTA